MSLFVPRRKFHSQLGEIRNPFIPLCYGSRRHGKKQKTLKHRAEILREAPRPLASAFLASSRFHFPPDEYPFDPTSTSRQPLRRNDISNIKIDDGFYEPQ